MTVEFGSQVIFQSKYFFKQAYKLHSIRLVLREKWDIIDLKDNRGGKAFINLVKQDFC